MNFDDYFTHAENRKYQKFNHCRPVERIFDFLISPESIAGMLKAVGEGEPALAGVIGGLEKLLEELRGPDFDVEDDSLHQCLGSLVKYIIRPYGLVVAFTEGGEQQRKPVRGALIKSATCYKRE